MRATFLNQREISGVELRMLISRKLKWISAVLILLGSCQLVKAANPCDINKDGTVNILDVQLEINEATAQIQAKDDLNGDGVVNILDVQIVSNAALGKPCLVTTDGTLTITVQGTGGSVAVSGESSCSSNSSASSNSCSYTLPLKTSVSVTPEPQSGYSAHTSGSCGTVIIGTVPQGCVVTFFANTSPPMGSLTVNVQFIGGSVAVSGATACSPGAGGLAHSCPYQFPIGTVVNVTPIPLSVFYFAETFGNCGRVTIQSLPQTCGVEFFSTGVP